MADFNQHVIQWVVALPRVSLALLSDMPLHYSSRYRSRYHRYYPTAAKCLLKLQLYTAAAFITDNHAASSC